MAERAVVIAGGGIGGLTAGLCFAQAGYAVRLAEQAREFSEVGAGIQLSANATKVLFALGLEEPLRAVSFLPQRTELRHWRSGRTLSETPLGAVAETAYGAPYLHVHRADLIALLVSAARETPDLELLPGFRVEGFEQGEDHVAVQLGSTTTRADLLLGADGIHSRVRECLFGAAAPRFTGNVAWRALVPADRLPNGLVAPVTSAWWGPGKHFVHYYVRGGELINCVCVVEQQGWETESWTEPGDREDLLQAFSGWHESLQQLMQAMDPETCYRWALHDRAPLERWGVGRVTLLGDACHPTLPFMAQGGAMAIEDAAVLLRSLEHEHAVEPALRRYERVRRPRTSRIQAGSRRNARIFHLRGLKAWARNLAVRRAAAGAMDWLYRYDPLTAPLD